MVSHRSGRAPRRGARREHPAPGPARSRVSAMGVIHLVRHGQADPSAYGVPAATPGAAGALTALGVRQARLAGAELRRRTDTVTAAVSGDLPRQRQTLAHVLDRLAAPPAPIVDPGWNEYPMPATVARADATQYEDSRAYQQLLDAGL